MKESSRSCCFPTLTDAIKVEVDKLLMRQDDNKEFSTIGSRNQMYQEQVLGFNIKTLIDKSWLDSAVFEHLFASFIL